MNLSIKHILLLFLPLGALLFSGCEKEIVKEPVVDSKPVFTANVSLGGDNFTLEAGLNNVLMETFTVLHNGVNRFSGKLGTEEVFVEMGVYQGDMDMNEPFSLKNFQGALHFIQAPTQSLISISKEDFPNAVSIEKIVWLVDGEQSAINTLQIEEPGKYQVCAEVHFYGGDVSTLCNELLVGYYTNANCRIRHFINANNLLKVWVDEATSTIESIDWYVDGIEASENNLLELQIDQNAHHVMAEIKFSNGAIRKKTIIADGSQLGHFVDDFSYVEESSSNQIRWDYGTLIRVKRNGKLYTTLGADNADSNIQVTDIKYYGLNDQGKQVYKCTAQVNAVVKDVASGEILPLSFTTVFGLEMN